MWRGRLAIQVIGGPCTARDAEPTTGVQRALSRHKDDVQVVSSRKKWFVLLVVGAAVVMGLPTVRGLFVGGDDHRLVLNHVLVSRPSLAHAVELFTIPHRDLYQPLPLLSFSFEFALARLCRFDVRGADGVAWLFHLDNVLLHALNAVLVWLVVLRLQGLVGSRRESEPALTADHAPAAQGRAAAVATVAALLFAVHPLQTEVVAWINGRMMLLSTMFALLTVLAFLRATCTRDEERASGGTRVAAWGIAAIVCSLLCAISKVRVGLPVIVLVPAIMARTLWKRRTVVTWIGVLLVTGIFAWVNIRTTADAELFSGGAKSLHGPRLVRVLLALAHYFQHIVWPVGLASYYPTPSEVRWADAATIRAVAIVVPVCALWLWFARRSMAARLGLVWFFATLASTLPFIPARNVLAADRYMYLPIIGLFWPAAVGLVHLAGRWMGAPNDRRKVVFGCGGAVVAACIGMSWHVGSFYATATAKTKRTAETSPDMPRAWTYVGSALFEVGDYAGAIEYAKRDLKFNDAAVQSGAWEIIGRCRLKLGQIEQGLADLHRAVELDDHNANAKQSLAKAYENLGRTAEAIDWYLRTIETAPRFNPPLISLAALYRAAGRSDEARALYEKALSINEYEVPAILGLAELDIESGDRPAMRDAERRLRALLEIVPENVSAWIDLGVVAQKLGRTAEAISLYHMVLNRDPKNTTAALNLAQIYQAQGKTEQAAALLALVRRVGVASRTEAIGLFDSFVRQEDWDQAIGVWRDLRQRQPESAEVQAWYVWALAVGGRAEQALAAADATTPTPQTAPLVFAAKALASLQTKDYAGATAAVVSLAADRDNAENARTRLLTALERHDASHPGDPWAICLAARVLISDGRLDAGRAFTDQCANLCAGDGCDAWVGELIDALGRGH